MPSDYSLTELANLAGVSVRTVRYYIAQGLLPSPVQQGPNTRYTDVHLDRLRVIKRLQAGHLPLAEIRRQMETLPTEKLASLAESAPAYEEPSDSALDYIESLLQPRLAMSDVHRAPPAAAIQMRAVEPAPMPPAMRDVAPTGPPPLPASARPPVVPSQQLPSPPLPSQPVPSQPSGPSDTERTQWDRIALDPDIELHIRRPLTRQHNKQVERLIKIARELLKEE